MNWRESFLARLQELTPLEILTYNAANSKNFARLFQDPKVIRYLSQRVKELDNEVEYEIESYQDFYDIVMSLTHEGDLLARLLYAMTTDKDAYWKARIAHLNETEKEALLASM